jgi:FtsP/CotA-like multicopper oxidase with cupredoxin domain
MSPFEQNKITQEARWLAVAVMLAVLFFAPPSMHAAIPGETGSSFNLSASAGYVSMPDGASIYSWGYAGASGRMQLPGPTLIVNLGTAVTVTLTNNLPVAAGNTSIVFPGQDVTATGGVTGLLTHEAQPGGTVTYTVTPQRPGTYHYHSGTRTDLRIEMGMYGALIVLPSSSTGCTKGTYSLGLANARAKGKVLGRPPLRKLTSRETAELQRQRLRYKVPFRDLATKFGVSVWTAHRLCVGRG